MMIKKFFGSAIAFLFLLGLLPSVLPTSADAAGLVPCGGEGEAACSLCHILELLKNILDVFLFPTVPVVAALLVAVGGFFFLASFGNPARLQQAKTIFLAVVIGLLIVYGSWVFISMLLTSMGVAGWTGLGTWWAIECPVPPPPPIAGCVDGTVEQNFGTLPSGDNVQGCDGAVPFVSAGSLCVAGWHVGDVILDAGLTSILDSNPSNIPEPQVRWIHVNGDPGDSLGKDVPPALPAKICWGTQSPCITSLVASTKPIHGTGGSPIYYNGSLALSTFTGDRLPGHLNGAICVEG